MKSYKYILCKEKNVYDLLSFIKKFWNKNHILTKNKKLFDWQYKNNLTKNYNFIIALSEKKKILGILGFIPLSQFSNKIKLNYGAWLSVWKVDEKNSLPGLGVGMLHFLKKNLRLNVILNLGMNDKLIPLHNDFLKHKTGHLSHSVLINNKRKNFKILTNKKNVKFNLLKNKKIKDTCYLEELDKTSFKKLMKRTKKNIFNLFSKKDFFYIINRYYKHPIYNYNIFAIKNKHSSCTSIIIMRKVYAKKSSILRIVDFLGEVKNLTNVRGSLKKLLYKENHEYIDFLQSGINKNVIKKAGFLLVSDVKNLVVPNYFEPFINKNIKINFAYEKKSKIKNVYFFKADGDQDRPN